jgi:hypothetical protein
MLGLPHKVVYEEATDSVAMEKTKQAIRYVCYKKDAPRGKGESSPALVSKKRKNSAHEDSPEQDSKKVAKSSQYQRPPDLFFLTSQPPPPSSLADSSPPMRQVSPLAAAGLSGPMMSTGPPPLLSLTPAKDVLPGSLLASGPGANAFDPRALYSGIPGLPWSSHQLMHHAQDAGNHIVSPSFLLPLTAGRFSSEDVLLGTALNKHAAMQQETFRAAFQQNQIQAAAQSEALYRRLMMSTISILGREHSIQDSFQSYELIFIAWEQQSSAFCFLTRFLLLIL